MDRYRSVLFGTKNLSSEHKNKKEELDITLLKLALARETGYVYTTIEKPDEVDKTKALPDFIIGNENPTKRATVEIKGLYKDQERNIHFDKLERKLNKCLSPSSSVVITFFEFNFVMNDEELVHELSNNIQKVFKGNKIKQKFVDPTEHLITILDKDIATDVPIQICASYPGQIDDMSLDQKIKKMIVSTNQKFANLKEGDGLLLFSVYDSELIFVEDVARSLQRILSRSALENIDNIYLIRNGFVYKYDLETGKFNRIEVKASS